VFRKRPGKIALETGVLEGIANEGSGGQCAALRAASLREIVAGGEWECRCATAGTGEEDV